MPQTRFWPEEPADLWGSPGVGWEIGGLWEALGLALESGGYSTEVELYRTTVCQVLCNMCTRDRHMFSSQFSEKETEAQRGLIVCW
jgi:hypothetical protein